jgi:F-type H+-transporting ATPase subunit gamma
VAYLAIGRKGRELLFRRHKEVIAEFSRLPNPPSFMDVSAIGRLVVVDFEKGLFDEVYIAYTEFISMAVQRPVIRKLLPLQVVYSADSPTDLHNITHTRSSAVFTYEPDQQELLNQIIPRFTALQIYQAILSAQASEHAARTAAMHNATQSANELIGVLQLEYNKLRQQLITNEMLDISGGAEALAQGES